MRSTTTTLLLLLSLALLLLGTSLAIAASDHVSQEAQLHKFLSSRALKRLRNRRFTANEQAEAESDPWANPDTFAHLPELCKATPPSGRKEADRVLGLPGQPPRVNFRQYSGYVTANPEHGRELFYYFVESPYDAASKPLILWLNGGPGCSSLGFGAMKELGPFRVNPDGTLRRNKHSWNNLANVIFLESPAGVGFSFSRNTTDYETVGDRRTAEDAYVFLVKWLERFPEYKGRDFYISGESYGGHYVPQLATVILSMNRFPGLLQPINLQGIFFGNPLLDDYLNGKGYLEFLWSHGVISDEAWARIQGTCTFTPSDDWQCFVAAHAFQKGNIDTYNIYAPLCLQARNGTYYASSHSMPGYDPCSYHYIEPYLNNHAVKQALHARVHTNWTGCNDDLQSDWNDAPEFMVPTIKRLVHRGLKVWIYSGDFDSVCSLTATRFSVNDMNLTITTKWRPWYTPDSEVGGYVQQYQGGFTFASVRAAGHLVPTFQPKRSLVLLYAFLKNMLPPADITK